MKWFYVGILGWGSFLMLELLIFFLSFFSCFYLYVMVKFFMSKILNCGRKDGCL